MSTYLQTVYLGNSSIESERTSYKFLNFFVLNLAQKQVNDLLVIRNNTHKLVPMLILSKELNLFIPQILNSSLPFFSL